MKSLTLILEAYWGLIVHDAFMARHDLRALHLRIKSFPVRQTKETAEAIERAVHALDVACVFYPKPVLCLQRSAVLMKILRKRGAPARVVIGAQKLPFKAHAWVEVNGQIINDRLASRERFLVLEEC